MERASSIFVPNAWDDRKQNKNKLWNVSIFTRTSEDSVWRTFVAFVRRLVHCPAQTFVKWAPVLCRPTQFRGINYPVGLLWLSPARVSAVILSHWCRINLFALSVDFVCRLYVRALGFVQTRSCQYFLFVFRYNSQHSETLLQYRRRTWHDRGVCGFFFFFLLCCYVEDKTVAVRNTAFKKWREI